MMAQKPSIGFTYGQNVGQPMMTEAVNLLLDRGQFLDVLGRLGVHHVDTVILSGTVDGQVQPDVVQVMDCVWPDPLSLACVIVHSSTHLEQGKHPWGGLGLEVMACTVEWVMCLLLGKEIPQDVKNRLEGWLDMIYEDELDALGLVR